MNQNHKPDGKELLGKTGSFQVVRRTNNGVYLSPPNQKELQILLPKGQVPEDTKIGDTLDSIFIYKDSEDRLTATTVVPKLFLGGLAKLTVKEVTAIGAFLDWGLAKDLLLPFKEQTGSISEGDEVLVALYLDKSSRLCATMKVYDYLKGNSPYKEEDHVSGQVYEITDSYGVFVAVDNQYSALIPNNELSKVLHIGDVISARIKNIREDGKLTLSLKEKVPMQMGIDAELILRRLKKSNGYLPFHDKTSPEILKREFSMSKNAFKRAVGRLLKEKIITVSDKGIQLIEQ
jgi:predicted RNA-binding protein (virulence factor B family)